MLLDAPAYISIFYIMNTYVFTTGVFTKGVLYSQRRNSEDMEPTTTQSKLVLDLGTKIEQKSGALLNFKRGTTVPVEEWIPENKMTQTMAINLRTAAQTKQHYGVTKLQQFNPSFFLVEEHAISCRVAGCSETMPRLKPSGDSPHIKQDLFLCKNHRKELANLLSKRCKEEGVSVNVSNYKQEHFNGYTSLIGELEKAFVEATQNMPQNVKLAAEVFLNARNFLTITHALLNPNGDNVRVVLFAWFVMFERVMDGPSLFYPLDRLVSIARSVNSELKT